MVMTEIPQHKKRHHYGWWVFLLAVLCVIVVVVLNRVWIYDWYRGVSYRPTDEMVNIRNALDLTSDGKFLFDAAQPALNSADEFNVNCRKDESNIAVLGCYSGGNIYIYDIRTEELDGIRELTTAHELLHAMWARMGEDEKRELTVVLKKVYEDNLDILKDDIETYDEGEQLEEIFVRAGTEVKVLPGELEKYYTEVFNNQDRIVEYYDSYISVFKEIRRRMETLLEEMEVLNAKITEATGAYELQAKQLEADVVSFNSCAEVVGCFADENDFNNQRANLVVRQSELIATNEWINTMIDEYNVKVKEYNDNVTESHKLHNKINSNSKVEI